MGNIVKFRRPRRGPFTARSRRRRSGSVGKSLVLSVILSASAVAAAVLYLEGGFFANTLVPAAKSVLSSCAIKGNISRSGERIYHVPGGTWYDRTKINPLKGERWFCSEAEAIATGWRKALR